MALTLARLHFNITSTDDSHTLFPLHITISPHLFMGTVENKFSRHTSAHQIQGNSAGKWSNLLSGKRRCLFFDIPAIICGYGYQKEELSLSFVSVFPINPGNYPSNSMGLLQAGIRNQSGLTTELIVYPPIGC